MRRFRDWLRVAEVCGLVWVPAAWGFVVEVVDSGGRPVEGAVVEFEPESGVDAGRPVVVEMGQKGEVFVPALVAVPAGSTVKFPNFDRVAHHVYSFSKANRFDLELYAGGEVREVVFDKPGVVVLGCNIHDWMVGHVYVAGSKFHGVTGGDGRVNLGGGAAGSGRVMVWHPRLRGEVVERRGEFEPGVVKVEGLQLRPEFRRRQAPSGGDGGGGY